MIPNRTMSGTCEISTAALSLNTQPPAFQGESGALTVSISFTLSGVAYSPAPETIAQVYLYYPGQNVMTTARGMTIGGSTATATLSAEDQATPGASYLVVQLVDTSSGATIVSCMAPFFLRQTRADALTSGEAPTPSEIVYVGRSPKLSEGNTWEVWDDDTALYVDSGISAIGPQGPQGETGATGATGPVGPTGATPVLTFTAQTGDPGTQVQLTQSGTAEAPNIAITIPRGDPGAVPSVNGQTGAVQLDGLIYETTSSALEDMSQEQQAELYAQGYRAIKSTNNETVVLLGLESDGSLSWIGCNQPRESILDNEDFAIAQSGYGGMHGTQAYAADRWIGNGTGATFAAGSNGGLSITCGTGAAGCEQVVAEPPEVGDPFSFIVVSGTTVLIASGTWTGTDQDATATIGALSAAVNEGRVQISLSSGSATVDYCTLLVGSYTLKTLPPWETPDYTIELLKCQTRYFKTVNGRTAGYTMYCQGLTVLYGGIKFPAEMRVIPTISNVTCTDLFSATDTTEGLSAQLVSAQGFCAITGITGNIGNVYSVGFEACADD